MEKLKRILANKLLIDLLGVVITINFLAVGWVSAVYKVQFSDDYLYATYTSFYLLLLVCFGEIIDPFITKYLLFLSKGRIQVQQTEHEQPQAPPKKNTTEIWLLLLVCTFTLNSCILLKDATTLDLLKVMTERKLKQMYGVDASFSQDSIILKKDFLYSDLEKHFSRKILREFTAKGHVEIENLNLKTNLSWRYYEKDYVPIVFINYNYFNYSNKKPLEKE